MDDQNAERVQSGERGLALQAQTVHHLSEAGLTCVDCGRRLMGRRSPCWPCFRARKEHRCAECCRLDDLVLRFRGAGSY